MSKCKHCEVEITIDNESEVVNVCSDCALTLDFFPDEPMPEEIDFDESVIRDFYLEEENEE